MHSIIQKLVVVFRQLVSSFQLLYLRGKAENCDLAVTGLAKVMMAKVTGYFC